MGAALALRVFLPFALGYYMSYVYRAINAVIAPDLVRDVGLDAASLGMLTSMYYLTFAAVQLPLGLVLDRVGPRRTETVLLLIAAAGALVFATAQSLAGLALGRGLIGIGVSACLMAGVTAFARWFPRDRLAFINGCLFTAGGLGAITATAPVEAALSVTDWRGVFYALAGATLTAAVLIFLVVPENDPGRAERAANRQSLGRQIADMRHIVGHRMFIRIMPLAILTQSANLSMPTLWAGPWLSDVAGLSRDAVATALLLIAAGLMAGFFCMGLIAERLQRRFGVTTAQTMIGFAVIYMLIQLAIILDGAVAPEALWALFAFTGTNGSLAYAALSQQFAPAIAGRVNTVLNLFVFVGAFAAQWGIGVIINLWPATGGHFAPEGYSAAFWTMLALQAAGLAWIPLSAALVRAFKSSAARDIGSPP